MRPVKRGIETSDILTVEIAAETHVGLALIVRNEAGETLIGAMARQLGWGLLEIKQSKIGAAQQLGRLLHLSICFVCYCKHVLR